MKGNPFTMLKRIANIGIDDDENSLLMIRKTVVSRLFEETKKTKSSLFFPTLNME
jgi:hypothetical protein